MDCVAHIPHKEWATDEERINYLTIERWSREVHDDPRVGVDGKHLHIPYKGWAADQTELENYLAIERWATHFQVDCLGQLWSPTAFTACDLHVPNKRWAYGYGNPQPHYEENNYTYLEQWSRRFKDCFPVEAPVPPGEPIGVNVVWQEATARPLPPGMATPVTSYHALAVLHGARADGGTPGPFFIYGEGGSPSGFTLMASATYTTGSGGPNPGSTERIEVWATSGLDPANTYYTTFDFAPGMVSGDINQCQTISLATTTPMTLFTVPTPALTYNSSVRPTSVPVSFPAAPSQPHVNVATYITYSEQATSTPVLTPDSPLDSYGGSNGLQISVGSAVESVDFANAGADLDNTPGTATGSFTVNATADLSDTWKAFSIVAVYA